MFQFARTSAKTAIIAAGAAGFVAFGAGIAGADAIGSTGPQDVAPTVTGLPEATAGAAHMLQESVESPAPAQTLPAPAASNLTTPSGDVSQLTNEADDALTMVGEAADVENPVQHTAAPAPNGTVHKAVNTLPVQHVAPGANGAVHSTVNKVLHSEGARTLPQNAELPETGVADKASSVLPRTTEAAGELANELPDASSAVENLPESPVTTEDVGDALPETGTDNLPQDTSETRDQASEVTEKAENVTERVDEARDEVPTDKLPQDAPAPADVPESADEVDCDEVKDSTSEVKDEVDDTINDNDLADVEDDKSVL